MQIHLVLAALVVEETEQTLVLLVQVLLTQEVAQVQQMTTQQVVLAVQVLLF